jgi:hypothetical protein
MNDTNRRKPVASPCFGRMTTAFERCGFAHVQASVGWFFVRYDRISPQPETRPPSRKRRGAWRSTRSSLARPARGIRRCATAAPIPACTSRNGLLCRRCGYHRLSRTLAPSPLSVPHPSRRCRWRRSARPSMPTPWERSAKNSSVPTDRPPQQLLASRRRLRLLSRVVTLLRAQLLLVLRCELPLVPRRWR